MFIAVGRFCPGPARDLLFIITIPCRLTMNENILFANSEGIVVSLSRIEGSDIYDNQVLGKAFWEVLNLEVDSLAQALSGYPIETVHILSTEDGEIGFRIVPLPAYLSPKGGFLVVCTDIGISKKLKESYQERIEDNISALEDSTNLFSSLFETIKDATIIADPELTIVAANPAATALLESGEAPLVGMGFKDFVPHSAEGHFDRGLERCFEEEQWTGRMDIISRTGKKIPVELVVWQVELTDDRMIQILLKDLTEKRKLTQGLEKTKTEVEGMNMAMKKLIQYMEEEKREIKDELVQQVKNQVLPTVERMAESRNPEQRSLYKRVIRSQIADISKGSQDKLERLGIMLTPREMDVCRMILLGKKGNEVAEAMSISFETLQTHRKNIRRKLNLTGKKIGLASYLMSLEVK